MNKVHIKSIDSNYLGVAYDKSLANLLNSYFHHYDSEYNRIPLTSTRFVGNDLMILLGKGYYDHLVKLFILNNITYTTDESIASKSLPSIILNDKWKSVLDTDYRLRNGKNQYYYINQLLEHNRASGQFHTGRIPIAWTTSDSSLSIRW
jgi:hypothetical protein